MKTHFNLNKSPKKGFLLLESLLAFSIFGIAVTSLVIALHQTAKVSYEINREAWAQAHLKNVLSETLTIPIPEDEFVRDEIRDLPEAKARIKITPNTDTFQGKNSSNAPLASMYNIEITLYWDEDGTQKTKTASTIHYYPLHQKR